MKPLLRAAIAQRASGQLGLVTVSQLVDLGVSSHQRRSLLERGDLVGAGAPEVYRVAGAPTSEEQRVLVAVLGAGAGAVASHSTAAALHALPGFTVAGHPIHVTVPHDRRPRAVDAIVHCSRALPVHHRATGRVVPVTNVARTLFDLGRVHKQAQVERALDNALASGLVTVPAVERVLLDLAGPGRSGTTMMRALLLERGAGYVAPRSRLERRFLDIVRQYGLPAPRREVDLGTKERWNGRVEFVFAGSVLAEVDGRRWHTALLDLEADADRDNAFRGAGFVVLRFRYRVLRDAPAMVAARIRAALETARRNSAA